MTTTSTLARDAYLAGFMHRMTGRPRDRVGIQSETMRRAWDLGYDDAVATGRAGLWCHETWNMAYRSWLDVGIASKPPDGQAANARGPL
jgi:hypothetical protein